MNLELALRPILVSACLLGLRTRYDGTSRRDDRVAAYLQREGLLPIPVCPEQLAGLPTPRPPTRFVIGEGEAVLDGSGRAATAEGTSMEEIFLQGAVETVKIARLTGCREALLKERSPSCGCRQVYRGEEIVQGLGITAALLARNDIRIMSEEDL